MIKIIKNMLLSTVCITCLNPVVSFAQNEEVLSEDVGGENIEESTIIYGEEFIAQQNGMVTALDLINRIPGGSVFLRDGGNEQRGFSSNNDPILINGHRVSAKSSSSKQALSQIPVGQVLRIEIIRGSSPDIKVSSQGALLNVVTKDDAKGSGSWKNRVNYIGGKLTGSIEGSYSGKADFVDYTASLELSQHSVNFPKVTSLYNAEDVLTYELSERQKRTVKNYKFSTNSTWHLNNGNDLHINGLVGLDRFKNDRDGKYLDSVVPGDLSLSGLGFFDYNSNEDRWEIGADYDMPIATDWTAKFIALHSQFSSRVDSGEDFDIINGDILQDYHVDQEIFSSENIGRAALVWQISPNHRLEFGSELSFNQQKTDFYLYGLTDGVLVLEDVDNSNITIKEIRDESFAIHSWKLSEKLSLDTALRFEISRLRQYGGDEKSRSFKYLKPSWDLRYNQTPNDQYQFTIQKTVSQLNFGDFASSFTGDNQVVGGNSNLKPEQTWKAELSFEHRFEDDMGYIKPTIMYERYKDKLAQVAITDEISGLGNAGSGYIFAYGLEGAIRFPFIGMPNLKLSFDVGILNSERTDPFTHQKVVFDYLDTKPNGSFTLRHDIPEYGFFWEIVGSVNPTREYRDYDEHTVFNPKTILYMFIAAEKQITEGLILRVSYDNIFNPKNGRHRSYYEDGRAGGVLTSFENRDTQLNRQLYITIKGSF